MRIDRKRALRIGGRAAGFVAAAALAVGTVAAAALVPWPEHRAEAPSVLVQPAESRQQRVCPGPLLDLGEDAAAATTASSVGSADLVTAARARRRRARGGAARGTRQPQRRRRRCTGRHRRRTGRRRRRHARRRPVAGRVDRDARRVRRCGLRRGRRGRVARGRRDQPRPQRTRAPLEPHRRRRDRRRAGDGEAGPVEAPSALGIIVPPGSQRVLSLAGLAPNLTSPVVHVTSTGGAIAASLETSVVVGLAPAGIELTGVTAAPATSQVIPGLVVPQAGGVEASEDHADGDDFPAVRLFAPGDDHRRRVDRRRARVRQRRQHHRGDAPARARDSTCRSACSTRASYTVRIEADAPVVAAARATVGGAPRARRMPRRRRTSPGPSPRRPSSTSAVIAVPPGPSPTLHLVNPGGAPAEVTVDRGRRRSGP